MRNLNLTLLLALFIWSCTDDGPEKNNSVPEKETEYSGENLEKDTLLNAKLKDTLQTDTLSTMTVSGKAIVFFMPTDKEFQAMIEKEGEESGITEVASDFSYYATEVRDSLKNSDIKIFFTSNPVIKIFFDNQLKIIDRRKQDHIVGSIFTDGKKEPQVNTGVYTDIDYWQMIGEYFSK